jgi:hypothetical protein
MDPKDKNDFKSLLHRDKKNTYIELSDNALEIVKPAHFSEFADSEIVQSDT